MSHKVQRTSLRFNPDDFVVLVLSEPSITVAELQCVWSYFTKCVGDVFWCADIRGSVRNVGIGPPDFLTLDVKDADVILRCSTLHLYVAYISCFVYAPASFMLQPPLCSSLLYAPASFMLQPPLCSSLLYAPASFQHVVLLTGWKMYNDYLDLPCWHSL
jgi:hypothetical protein